MRGSGASPRVGSAQDIRCERDGSIVRLEYQLVIEGKTELVEFGPLAELESVRKVYIGWGRYVYDI